MHSCTRRKDAVSTCASTSQSQYRPRFSSRTFLSITFTVAPSFTSSASLGEDRCSFSRITPAQKERPLHELWSSKRTWMRSMRSWKLAMIFASRRVVADLLSFPLRSSSLFFQLSSIACAVTHAARTHLELGALILLFAVRPLVLVEVQLRLWTGDHIDFVDQHLRGFLPQILPWNLANHVEERQHTFKDSFPTYPPFTWMGRFKNSSAYTFTCYA